MQTRPCLAALVLLSTVASPVVAADAAGDKPANPANPLRRVINMLEMMAKKVEEEGQQQQLLYDKYSCFCMTSLKKLNADIDIGKAAVPELEGKIQESVATKGGLENRVSEAKGEHAEATTTLEEATSQRQQQNKDFTDESGQKKVDIKTLKQAVAVMDKVSGGGFLQMSDQMTSTIRRLVSTSAELSSSDRDLVTSFLSEGQGQQDGSSDGMSEASVPEITGMLKQMLDTMKKEQAVLAAAEANSLKQFESLKTAKDAQILIVDKEIKTKQERLGQIGMQMVEDKQKLEETKKALEANKKLEANLSKECKARPQEYEVESKTRAEEGIAIADTIRILNDDVAAKLFRKALPSVASLLQMQVSPKKLKGDALATLQKFMPKGKGDPRMDFVALALRSKKTNFAGVVKMIDDMVALLNKEQKDDVEKKQYCESEITKTEDEKKDLGQAISDSKKAIEQTTQKLQTTAADIIAKGESIRALDKQVAEATKQRKAENQDYTENLSANSAAKEILGLAKVRLGKFYNAEKFIQVKAEKTSLIQAKVHHTKRVVKVKTAPEDRGSPLKALFDQGAFSFMQMQSEADPTYTAAKKRQDGNVVITLITTIMADIDKEVQEITKTEKEAQFAYEQAMKDSAEKRAGDAKAIGELEGVKAAAEANIHKLNGSVKAKTKHSEAKTSFLKDLHKQCDYLLKHFEARRTSRTSEIDALQKAKAVLNSADADFLQLSARTVRAHGLLRGHA